MKMFYICLVVLLVCLLITLYFHHKVVCVELENIKKMLKKDDVLVGKEIILEKNDKDEKSNKCVKRKKSNDRSMNTISIEKPIATKVFTKPVNRPSTFDIEKQEIFNPIVADIDKCEIQSTTPKPETDNIEEAKPFSFVNPIYTVVDLEKQVLEQINREIKNSEIKMNERVEIIEDGEKNDEKDEEKVDKVKEVITEDVSNENKNNDIVEDKKDDDVNKNDDVEIKEEVNEIEVEEKKDDDVKVNNNEEEIKLDIDNVAEIISSSNKDVINDILNGDYKYQQIVKKCKDIGVDVKGKKKDEIFELLRTMV